MAKLEARVNTLELLDAIRDGATKTELIKKYRTSEAELASVLHSFFRNRKMTAEEFNNFFKGLPVTRPELVPMADLVGTGTAQSEDAPSSGTVIPLTATDSDMQNLDDQLESEPAPTAEETVPATEMLPAFTSPKSEIPLEGIIPDEPAGLKVGLPADSAGMGALLDMIFSRLTSIDSRLAEIERKLQGW